MLESILLKNFQAHRRLEVAFSPTVTSIVGPTDVGKTAIIRALRWVCLNEAAGGATRHGAKKTSVRIKTDGHTITRRRVGNGNSYVCDGKSYAAIRRDVPVAVRSRLKVSPLNFQGQHDPPYWLHNSAGAVSRELNEIVDLGIIDKTLAGVQRASREAATLLGAAEGRFAGVKKAAEELAWTQTAIQEFKALEEKEEVLVKLRQRAASLAAMVDKAGAAQAARERGGAALQAALSLLGAAKAARSTAKARKGLQTTLQQATKATARAAAGVPSLERLGTALRQREGLETLVTKLEQEKRAWQKATTRLTATSKSFLVKAKGRCPLCGSTTK